MEELHNKIFQVAAEEKRATRAAMETLYESLLAIETKGIIPNTFKEQFPEQYMRIAEIKGAHDGSRKTVTAQLLYLYIYKSYPKCPICGYRGPKTLGDRPGAVAKMCSHECSRKYAIRCIEEKMTVEHGVQNFFASAEFDANRRVYLNEKYGTHVNGPLHVPGALEKVRSTSRERFGTDHFSRSDTVKQKIVKTVRETYGQQYSNSCQLPRVREGLRRYSQEVYGVDHLSQAKEVKEQKRKKSLEKFGTNCVLQAEEVKQQIVATNIEKYGYAHRMQDPEEFERRQKSRTYIGTWRGHTFRYQGCEGLVLASLEQDKRVRGMQTKRSVVGTVRYTKPNGKVAVYYPDIALLMHDDKVLIVEAKANRWLGFGFDEAMFNTNLAKFKAAHEHYTKLGKEFILALYEGGRIYWIRHPHKRLAEKIKRALKQK